MVLAVLSGEDFSATGAEDSYAEGIVDQLRAVRGTKVAALIREAVRRPRRGAQGLAARQRRRCRRLGDRTRLRRRRAPSRRRLHQRLPTAELIDAIRARI